MNFNNIDITMFLEFPGILITIGVILLLISIIIIIFAYKVETKVVDASKLSTNLPKENHFKFEEPKEENKELDNDDNDAQQTKVFKPSELSLKPEENVGITDKIVGAEHAEEKPKDDINKLIEEIEKPKQVEEKPEIKEEIPKIAEIEPIKVDDIKEEIPKITEIEPIKDDEIKTIDAFETEFGSYDDKDKSEIEEPKIEISKLKDSIDNKDIYETILIDDKESSVGIEDKIKDIKPIEEEKKKQVKEDEIELL